MFKNFKSFSGSHASGRRYSGRIEIPTKVPNNTYWFSSFENTASEFGTVLANNATVTNWKDKSGAAHDLNKSGNSSVKPVFKTNIQNGAGAVYFDGVDDSLNVNPITFLQSKSSFTTFVVAKPVTLSTGASLTCTDTDGYKIFYNGTNWGIIGAGGTGISTYPSTTNTVIFTSRFDGTAGDNSSRLQFRINKATQTLNFGATTVGATTSAAATYFYAGQNSNGTAFYNGYMMEIVLYSRALTPSEIESIENYFVARWNIIL